MPLKRHTLNRALEQIAQSIDIPPSKYQQAVDRYKAVGKHLENGDYPGISGEMHIYPQGSFNLGTVTKPLNDDGDYDIDLVCEMPTFRDHIAAHTLKRHVGDRLKEHGQYARMLDEEGKRCWTLLYSEPDSVGFHLDVLPAAAETADDTTVIAITNLNRDDGTYSWCSSNPLGYGEWFEQRNAAMFETAARMQKSLLLEKSEGIYAKVDDVPDQLVRTPLQQAIQIMKRHRDVRFKDHANSKSRPISIIITTLAAYLYEGEDNVLDALQGIARRLDAHNVLMKSMVLAEATLSELGVIQRLSDGTWYIPNPVNKEENFADRWHEDQRAEMFFQWVAWLREDILSLVHLSDEQTARKQLAERLCIAPTSAMLALLECETVAAQTTPVAPAIHVPTGPKPWRK